MKKLSLILLFLSLNVYGETVSTSAGDVEVGAIDKGLTNPTQPVNKDAQTGSPLIKSQIKEQAGTVLVDANAILPFVQVDSATVSSMTVSGQAFINILTATTGTINSFMVVGVTDGSDSPLGRIGQYISSTTAESHTFTTNNQYADLVALSIPAGDWELSALMVCDNVANFTATRLGISTTAGNSSTGLVQGDNLAYNSFSSNTQNSSFIPGYRVSISATTTYYLKFLANYTGTVPTAKGRLSAVRIR